MELGLKGKQLVVTAASKGLGLAVAEKLAAEGANLVLCSRRGEVIEAIAHRLAEQYGITAYGFEADVASPIAIQNLVEFVVQRFGHIDGLLCNAGGPVSGRFLELDDAAWEQAFQNNLMSVIRLIRGFYPLLSTGGGRVLTIASTSIRVPIPGLILSNVFRAGIAGLMKTLASELASDGILVNTICPGKIATDRLEQLDQVRAAAEGITVAELQQDAAKDIPLGRYGKPEELADFAAYLLSARNSYMTGSVYNFDGGLIKSI